MLPECSREQLLKKNAVPLDRKISVFLGKTQSHARVGVVM